MADTPEGKVKKSIKKLLDKYNIWYFMPAANGFGKVGIPDFICCANGRFLGIEAKAPGKKGDTTPNQDARIAEILAHGGEAIIIDDPDELEEYLNERHY